MAMTKTEAEELLGLTNEPYDSEMVKRARRSLLVKYSMNRAARGEGVTDEEARTMTPVIRAASATLLRAVGQSETGVVAPGPVGDGQPANRRNSDAGHRTTPRRTPSGGGARHAEEPVDTDAWAQAAASWTGQTVSVFDEGEQDERNTSAGGAPRAREGRRRGAYEGRGSTRRPDDSPRRRPSSERRPRPEDVPVTKNKLLAPISLALRALGSDVTKLSIAVFVIGGLPSAFALQPTVGLLMNPETSDSAAATVGLVILAIGITICVLEARRLISPRLQNLFLGAAVGIDLSDARGGLLSTILKVVLYVAGRIGALLGKLGGGIWNWLKEAAKD